MTPTKRTHGKSATPPTISEKDLITEALALAIEHLTVEAATLEARNPGTMGPLTMRERATAMGALLETR